MSGAEQRASVSQEAIDAAHGMENMRFALYGHDKHVARAVFRYLNDCCLLSLWQSAQGKPVTRIDTDTEL